MPDSVEEEVLASLKTDEAEFRFVSAMERLIKYPEWDIYINTVLKPQVDLRKKYLVDSITTPQEQSEHNVKVGEILGLNLAINLPSRLIQNKKDKKEVENLLNPKEKEEGD